MKEAPLAGNVDDPEGSLDALMQVLKSLMISETTNEANFELKLDTSAQREKYVVQRDAVGIHNVVIISMIFTKTW